MRLFIENPGLAMLVGALFTVLSVTAALKGRRLPGIWPLSATTAWWLYWIWEVAVPNTGEEIRVDLLAIYPILAVVSLGALAQLSDRRPNNTDRTGPPNPRPGWHERSG